MSAKVIEKFETINGTIRRVAPNDLVYVELDPQAAHHKTVSFMPSVVEGYMGQPLRAFGLRPGVRVEVSCLPSSGYVEFVQVINSADSVGDKSTFELA